MATLFYSPHATSTDNEAGRASGHADVPLSAEGERLARELGGHYASLPVDAVYCSDLQRARRTAELAFAHRGVTIRSDRRLRELDYGELTQRVATEVHAEFPWRLFEPFPGGESLAQVTHAVGTLLREALGAWDDAAIVIVGHAATRYAVDYWTSDRTLAEIVASPWEWRDVPIWRFELSLADLAQRADPTR